MAQRGAHVASTPPRLHSHDGERHDAALKPKRVYRFGCVRISRRTLLGSLALAVATLVLAGLLAARVCSVPDRVEPRAVAVRGGMGSGYLPATLDAAAIARSCAPAAGGTDERRMTVVVTGAAGFVGFHAARALKRAGHGVVGLDNFNSYYSVALKRARAAELAAAGVHVAAADLNDAAALGALFRACPPSHVLHLAAQAGVRYAAKNPSAYVHSNVAGFVTLLEALVRLDPPPALVFASSSSVYGLNEKVPFSEDDLTERPASLYAATKKANELLAHTYAHLYGLSATGLRFFTVYGPWGRPDMAAFAFARAITSGAPVRIFQGPGGAELSRDFTYVDDIVAGALAALTRAAPSGRPARAPRVYNLGNTRPVNVSHFVTALERALGRDAVRAYVPVGTATGDVQHTHADVSRAAAELGYLPRVPLEAGLQLFADWFVAHYGGGRHARELEGWGNASRRGLRGGELPRDVWAEDEGAG